MFCTGIALTSADITDTERALVDSRVGGTQCEQNGGGGGGPPVNCNLNARIPDLFAGRDYMYVSLCALTFVCMRSKARLAARQSFFARAFVGCDVEKSALGFFYL